jgi:predicted GNAT family acetyltransferase
MTQPNITQEDHATWGRYVARLDGIDAEAGLVYRRSSDKLITAEHTGVPDAFRGRGVGRALVTRMVEDARAQGLKIIALCTYVNAERKKHPEWADVFQN